MSPRVGVGRDGQTQPDSITDAIVTVRNSKTEATKAYTIFDWGFLVSGLQNCDTVSVTQNSTDVLREDFLVFDGKFRFLTGSPRPLGPLRLDQLIV